MILTCMGWLDGSFTDMTILSMALTVNLVVSAISTFFSFVSSLVGGVVESVRGWVKKGNWDEKIAQSYSGSNSKRFVSRCDKMVALIEKYEAELKTFGGRASKFFRVLMILAAIVAVVMAARESKSHWVVFLFAPYILFCGWSVCAGLWMVGRLVVGFLLTCHAEKFVSLDNQEDLEKIKKQVIDKYRKVSKK